MKEEARLLLALFARRKMTPEQGMDWLQGEGRVADNCVTVEDVAAVDARRVLAEEEKGGAR